ncbi:MAG: hypothetical protein HY698_17895 [Deltaproteobacteria bacterium]|nr:hypothetical protein [Deltaproteobacteria bacterium]
MTDIPARLMLASAVALSATAQSACNVRTVWECVDGTSRCGEACVDLQRDPSHCGTCERACGEGLACMDASCGFMPPSKVRCVAVGDSGVLVYRDTEGGWSASEQSGLLTQSRLRSVRFQGGFWLAAGDGGVLLRSIDGKTWFAARASPLWSGAADVRALAASDGLVLATGMAGRLAWSESGGNAWTDVPDVGAGGLHAAEYSLGTWIAVDWIGGVFRSADDVPGKRYLKSATLGGAGWSSVAARKGAWMAAGSALLAASEDAGVTWSPRTVPSITGNLVLGTDGGLWMCGGDDGTYALSSDLGETWSAPKKIPGAGIITGIFSGRFQGGNRWFVTTASGQVEESTDAEEWRLVAGAADGLRSLWCTPW